MKFWSKKEQDLVNFCYMESIEAYLAQLHGVT
jgi:hypothetical protein